MFSSIICGQFSGTLKLANWSPSGRYYSQQGFLAHLQLKA
jgi:hypothetical protein